MGHVDRVDKNVSLFRLRLKRCMKRYHRALLVWYMAIVLNNMLVLCELLFPEVKVMKKSKARLVVVVGSVCVCVCVCVCVTQTVHTTNMTILYVHTLLSHRIGWKHWFQNALGNALISEGICVSVASATV